MTLNAVSCGHVCMISTVEKGGFGGCSSLLINSGADIPVSSFDLDQTAAQLASTDSSCFVSTFSSWIQYYSYS